MKQRLHLLVFHFATVFNTIVCFDSVLKVKIDNQFNDDRVVISNELQDEAIKLQEQKCSSLPKPQDSNKCSPRFDKIYCWPEGSENETVVINCPNYIDGFNKKNQLNRTCYFNGSRMVWSKPNYILCGKFQNNNDSDQNDLRTFEWVLKQYKIMFQIRVFGYSISLISLIFSTVILSTIRRFRRPENYVNISLFISFILRTILIILTYEIIESTDNTNKSIGSISTFHIIGCKASVLLFRYSGAVNHAAITSKALFLVLVLRDAFSSDAFVSKVCICVTWSKTFRKTQYGEIKTRVDSFIFLLVIPLFWILPWFVIKLTYYIDKEMTNCWQIYSIVDLIIKIPITLLMLTNLICVFFVLKVSYSSSKMETNVRLLQKAMVQKRFAKSILVLTILFGVHLIIFAWTTYIVWDAQSIILLVVLQYFESIFLGFQGLLVSIICCFTKHEFRIELLILLNKLLKSDNFYSLLPFCQLFNPDYERLLRQKHFTGVNLHGISKKTSCLLSKKSSTITTTDLTQMQMIK